MTIFDDLPMVQLRCAWTDDDNNFHGDILYFRGLLDDIYEMCFFGARAKPFPEDMSAELDAALAEVKDMPTGVPDFLKLVRPWI